SSGDAGAHADLASSVADLAAIDQPLLPPDQSPSPPDIASPPDLSCSLPQADCDNNAANGCEVNVSSDAKNCGACGNVCPLGGSGAKCVAGVCSTLPPVDGSLIGYWSLDDAGPMIKDASGNA